MEDRARASGRTGTLTTKLHPAVDSAGPPLAVILTPGQAGDNPQPLPLLDNIRDIDIDIDVDGQRVRVERAIADKAHAHPSTRAALRQRRIKATLPEHVDRIDRRSANGSAGGRPPTFDPDLYNLRNVVERCFNRLKQFRGLATRFAKRAAYHRAEIVLASIVLHLRRRSAEHAPGGSNRPGASTRSGGQLGQAGTGAHHPTHDGDPTGPNAPLCRCRRRAARTPSEPPGPGVRQQRDPTAMPAMKTQENGPARLGYPHDSSGVGSRRAPGIGNWKSTRNNRSQPCPTESLPATIHTGHASNGWSRAQVRGPRFEGPGPKSGRPGGRGLRSARRLRDRRRGRGRRGDQRQPGGARSSAPPRPAAVLTRLGPAAAGTWPCVRRGR